MPAALNYADEALVAGTRIIDYLATRGVFHMPIDLAACIDNVHARQEPFPELDIIGGSGKVVMKDVSGALCQVDVYFVKEQYRAALEVKLKRPLISYCPSAMESTLLSIPNRILDGRTITLPLANGILQMESDLFTIKDSRFYHGCVRITGNGNHIAFEVEGRRNQSYSWRFYLLRTTLPEEALEFANRLNVV